MKDLISVIVPIYKTEKYLSDCINSILNQTYRNLEIILVDDGSPDNCPFICDEYEKKDSRIYVVHKKNGGLSDARNIGIEHANGKYIAFIDSDDFIDSSLIEKLYYHITKNNADISMCNFKYYYMDEIVHEEIISPVKNEVLDKNEAISKLFEHKNWYYVIACNKLYKKELWNDIRYPKGFIHEDEAVIHRLLYKCKKIVTTEEQLYFYRQTPGSIMNSNNIEKKLDIYFALEDRILFLKNKISNKQMDILLSKYWFNYLDVYFKVSDLNPNLKRLNEVKKSLKNILPFLIRSNIFTKRDLFGIILFIFNPMIYRKIFCKK